MLLLSLAAGGNPTTTAAAGPGPVVCPTAAAGPAGPVTGTGLDPVQTANAAALIRTGQAMRVPTFGLVIEVAVARQESGLRNLASPAVPESLTLPHDAVQVPNYDSVGINQQRTSWGSVADRMNPATSARLFYTRLLKVPGWQAMPLTVAAQHVQGSATPNAYAQWEVLATRVVTGTGGCLLGGSTPADARTAATAILTEWGTRITGTPQARADMAATASGAGFPACGHLVHLDPDLLRLVRFMLNSWKLDVSDFDTGHDCDHAYHPPGMAGDFDRVTEIRTGLSTNFHPGESNVPVVTRFINELAAAGPDHLWMGQQQCPDHGGGSPVYLTHSGADTCTHQHVNVHQGDPQWGPYTAERWPS